MIWGRWSWSYIEESLGVGRRVLVLVRSEIRVAEVGMVWRLVEHY